MEFYNDIGYLGSANSLYASSSIPPPPPPPPPLLSAAQHHSVPSYTPISHSFSPSISPSASAYTYTSIYTPTSASAPPYSPYSTATPSSFSKPYSSSATLSTPFTPPVPLAGVVDSPSVIGAFKQLQERAKKVDRERLEAIRERCGCTYVQLWKIIISFVLLLKLRIVIIFFTDEIVQSCNVILLNVI